MPPGLACKFTVSELAVLRIVGDEVRGQGACARTIDEIAARAGTCRRMVQNAIRVAAAMGLLTVRSAAGRARRTSPTSSGSSAGSGCNGSHEGQSLAARQVQAL